MNKNSIILSSICTLTSISSFGMLTKTLPTKHIKKMRSFHTSAPMHSLLAYGEAERAKKKAQEALDKANTNNELLHKIIQQNEENNKILKENNELLRAVIRQNCLLYDRGSVQPGNNVVHKKLNVLHNFLEKKYDIEMHS